MTSWHAASVALLGAALVARAAADDAPPLQACNVHGIAHEVLCGKVSRPLDPADPARRAIDVHYVVVPATARRKHPDPVFLFAGGPGQSAIESAPQVLPWFSRLSNRRDIVLVDQRGTGRSAPLTCDDEVGPAERLDEDRQVRRLHACRDRLATLAHGDLRQYTTAIAIGDIDAVRRQLGADRINLVGFSYGTRAALELLRQYPQSVRSAVLDGVAPPDMALPASHSTDVQAALDALFLACDEEPACRARHPRLALVWQALLRSLPREVTLPDALTGRVEHMTMSRAMLLQAVRGPLYTSALASALPHAIEQAALGNMQPLAGLGSLLGQDRGGKVAMGMHFSVVCSEDMPLVARAPEAPGADAGADFARLYREVCEGWPRGEVPAGFYRTPPSAAPVLILSGAIDPVTPPRHGERVRQALGANARHVIVPNTGHNVLALGCMRDVLFRFIDTRSAAAALTVDATCAAQVPRPGAFEPVRRGAAR